jgi:hypothetical protein
METYSHFFNTELFKEVYEYAKQAIYRKTEDNIYNFRGAIIQGELKEEIEQVFRQHGLIGSVDILRVQQINPTVRVATAYHRHGEKYKENVVCFLNNDFTGGIFEYLDEGIVQIEPKPNTAVVFGPALRHRVLPVTEGVRYTLVAFLAENSYLNKQDKTLI